jgi:hypothetical protein
MIWKKYCHLTLGAILVAFFDTNIPPTIRIRPVRQVIFDFLGTLVGSPTSKLYAC